MSEKILIVDDDPSSVEKLYSFFQAKNFEVAAANNGERAYKVALNVMPDLIIMDVLMPGWDGYETTKVFKSDPQLQDIPIIFVTAKLEEAEKAFGYGAVDYVIKPFSNEELQARIDFQLRAVKRFKEVQNSNTKLNQKLDMKERELVKAQEQISNLKQQLNNSNITATNATEDELVPDRSDSSFEEFGKRINPK
jgi:DNA-binding response OmpR family regulator|tara:strand:- start:212 stop:793 length:582 start_codon:yes stop_codon:yes gene_type:complete